VLQVPAALAVALNGIIVIFVVSSTPVRGWIQRSLSEAGLFNRRNDSKTENPRRSRSEPDGLSDMPDPSEESEHV